jgi:hypothetical protein
MASASSWNAGLDPTVVLHQFLGALGAKSGELASTIEVAARAYRSRLAGRRVLVADFQSRPPTAIQHNGHPGSGSARAAADPGRSL